MFSQKFKNTVKVCPPLYKTAHAVAEFYRRARQRTRIRTRNKAIEHFRKYCLNLPKLVSNPFFVKVGANDGIGDDPCSDIFLADTHWSGLLIEPVFYCFERLKANFPDTRRFSFEQIAIGSPAGETSFFYVDATARDRMPNWEDWFDKLGSFDRNHIIKHAGGVLEPFIVEGKVQVRPLSEVLARRQIKEVHLLHVDAEGYDYEVLKTLDFGQITPLAVFIENDHLSEADKIEVMRFFNRHGYSVRDCIGDFFAIHEETNRRLQAKASDHKR